MRHPAPNDPPSFDLVPDPEPHPIAIPDQPDAIECRAGTVRRTYRAIRYNGTRQGFIAKALDWFAAVSASAPRPAPRPRFGRCGPRSVAAGRPETAPSRLLGNPRRAASGPLRPAFRLLELR